MYLRIPWRFLASASEIGIREDSDKHIRASGESQTSDNLKESLDALPWQPIQNHLSQNFSTYFWQHHDFINLWLPRLPLGLKYKSQRVTLELWTPICTKIDSRWRASRRTKWIFSIWANSSSTMHYGWAMKPWEFSRNGLTFQGKYLYTFIVMNEAMPLMSKIGSHWFWGISYLQAWPAL